jgi:predicted DNA-binding transcriptional regulator YafY
MDLGMGGSVTTLRRKLVAALPAEQRQSATRMSRCFLFDAPGWYQDTERPAHLPAVTDAVLNGHRIRIRYSSWERESTKTLEPYGLVLKGGRWYLVAASNRQTRSPNTYRVDQIVAVTPLDQPFEPLSDFDLATYWNDSVRSFKERLRSGTALIRLSETGAEHYRQATGERPVVTDRSTDGWSTALVPIESIGHARGVFLQLGAHVEVLEPADLRAAMTAAAHELAALYEITA